MYYKQLFRYLSWCTFITFDVINISLDSPTNLIFSNYLSFPNISVVHSVIVWSANHSVTKQSVSQSVNYLGTVSHNDCLVQDITKQVSWLLPGRQYNQTISGLPSLWDTQSNPQDALRQQQHLTIPLARQPRASSTMTL